MKRQSVVCVLRNNDEILLLKRHPFDRTLANTYCLPGGKVDDTDKTLIDAIKRETFEETGLIVYNLKVFCVKENEKFIINCFTGDVDNFDVKLSDEHDSYLFQNIEDIRKNDMVGVVTKELLLEYFT